MAACEAVDRLIPLGDYLDQCLEERTTKARGVSHDITFEVESFAGPIVTFTRRTVSLERYEHRIPEDWGVVTIGGASYVGPKTLCQRVQNAVVDLDTFQEALAYLRKKE